MLEELKKAQSSTIDPEDVKNAEIEVDKLKKKKEFLLETIRLQKQL